MPSADFCLSVP